MAKHIRIVLADDHFPVREGTKAILAKEADFVVVGEAENGQLAVDLIEKLRPEVLICDLTMPQLTGHEVIRRVTQRVPETQIVVLSMHTDDPVIAQVFQNGGSAYILKSSTGSELVKAVRTVLAGERYLGQPFAEKGLAHFLNWDLAAKNGVLEQLTDREREVLQLVAEGKTSAEIAILLNITQRTVETHRANIMRKLNLSSVADLIRLAIRSGLLPLD